MEFGGYLPIELNRGAEYYEGEYVLRFNCARSALEYVIEKTSFNGIHIPFWMCESVRNVIIKHDIKLCFYHINELFCPMISSIPENDVIFIPNYFGLGNNHIDYLKKYKNVIFDNTQAFFAEPVYGAYNIYSCRKLLGVCDGAYLVHEGVELEHKERNVYIPQHAQYLYDAVNISTNEAYETNLKNEEQLATSGICDMSVFSRQVLCNADYQDIVRRRRENYEYLHSCLRTNNELHLTLKEKDVPMVYPLLLEDDNLRGKLIAESIYVPQWWKYLLAEGQCSSFEEKLSKYLVPLPVDQRYIKGQLKILIKKFNSII